MKIKNFEIDAIIFDLDGTLLDSTLVWKDIDKGFFSSRGQEVPPTYGKDISTLGLDEAAVYTKNTYFPLEEVEDIKKEWLDAVLHKYKEEVGMKEYAKEFLEYLDYNNVPFAVATANSEECYIPCLDNNKIKHYFKYICDVKRFKNGKRTPEIYLHVAEVLKSNPSKTMVFEDTLEAIKTALNAGFKVCAIFDEACSKEDEIEKEKISDIYIRNFKEIFD